jgi:hypothetical protein
MKKLLIFLLLFIPSLAYGQTINVKAIVADSKGELYQDGIFTVQLIVPPNATQKPLYGGSVFQTSFVGNIDGNGNMGGPGGIWLFDNNLISDGLTPSGTQWLFSICATLQQPFNQKPCFNLPLTITGSSPIDISAQLTAVAPLLCMVTLTCGGSGGSGLQQVGMVGDGTVFQSTVLNSPVTTANQPGPLTPVLKSVPAGYALLGPRPVVPGTAAFVQSNSAYTAASNPATVVIPLLSNSHAADGIIFTGHCLTHDDNIANAVVTDTQGNTYTNAIQNGSDGQWFTYNILGGADTITVTFTYGGGQACNGLVYSIREFTNMNGSVDASGGNSQFFSSGTYITSVTTTQPNDLLVMGTSNDYTAPPTIVAASPIFTIDAPITGINTLGYGVFADAASTTAGTYSVSVASAGTWSTTQVVAYETGGTFNNNGQPTYRLISPGDLPVAATPSPYTVLNNQANAYTTGSQDFTHATKFLIPTSNSPIMGNWGQMAFDLVKGNYKGYIGNADGIFAGFAAGLNPGNGNCPDWINSSGTITLGDTGSPCGSGGGGSGTVTSFTAGNLSPLFNTSVATGTTTPALTFAQINQNANLVFAGPGSGGASAPTFRLLVSADIPNNAANTSGTAAGLSGTPALPNGTTCTTQSTGDSSTKCATTAFVANTFAAPPALGSGTPAAASVTTLTASNTVSGVGFTNYLASPPAIGGTAPAAGHFTTGGYSGQFTSGVTTGTPPFILSSSTMVTGLNANYLGGATFANPGSIGSGTPGPIAATTLTSSSTTTLNGTTIPASSTLTKTIGSGQQALSTSAISPGSCATTITISVSGVAATDNVLVDFASSPLAVTGYAPTGSVLTIYKWAGSGNVNIAQCNNAGNSASITPGAMTVNYRVVR